MVRWFGAYVASLLALGVLDYLWLRVIAARWYEQALAPLMAPQINVWAAAAFYLLYPIGLLLFVVQPAQGDWLRAAMWGALFGFFAYGTYDATNLAILRDWPLALSLVDVAWGAFISAATAAAATAAWRWLQG